MYFRFLNIPVVIHPSFWLFLLFFTDFFRDPTMEAVLRGAIFFFSLLVHEYGHALTARYFGAEPTVHLEALGGNAQYYGRGMRPLQHFLITLNGPLFDAILILVAYSFLQLDVVQKYYYLHYFFWFTMRLNIWWCLLNLIPILPLDGGHLLHYLLEMKFGSKGYRASLMIGFAASLIFVPFLFLKGLLFFAGIIAIYGFLNFQRLRQFRVSDYKPADPKQALKKKVKSKEEAVHTEAIEELAKEYYKEEEKQKAYELLLAEEGKVKDKSLLCKLAFEFNNDELVSKYSRDLYEAEPTFETAILNSMAFARLKEANLSAAWLETASEFGEEYRPFLKQALEKVHFDAIRKEEIFQEKLKKILRS